MDCYDRLCKRIDKKHKRKEPKKIAKIPTNIVQYYDPDVIFGLLSNLYAGQFEEPQLSETLCWDPILKCATKIVDLTIILAESFVGGTNPKRDVRLPKLRNEPDGIWPTAGQLNFWSGAEAIEKFIGLFDYDPSLKYCVNILSQEVDQVSSTFTYEVIWGIPTKLEPIQSVSKMFFNLRRYKNQSSRSPIEVTFVYENSNLILRPGDIRFKENWIMNALQAKFDFIARYGIHCNKNLGLKM